MRINTNSWHYRLNRYTWGNSVPEHLCPYARSLLFSLVIGGWLQYMFDHININFQMPHWGITRILSKIIRENTWFFNIETFYCVWGIFGIWRIMTGHVDQGIVSVTVTAGSYVVCKTMGRTIKFFESKSSEFKGFSEKSIVLQSVVSNHSKICPKLDFIDTKIVKFNEDVSQMKETLIDEKLSIKNKHEKEIIKTDSQVK